MKKKIMKICLILLGIILVIFGINQMIKHEIVAIQGNLSQSKSSNVGKLAAGELNPSIYNYNINIGKVEGTIGRGQYEGFQIYCIDPNTPINYGCSISYDDARSMVGKKHDAKCSCAETPSARTPNPTCVYSL